MPKNEAPQKATPASKPTAPKQPAVKPPPPPPKAIKPKVVKREIVYPTFVMVNRSAGCTQKGPDGRSGPLTAADMKTMLGWETEKEYIARQMALKPKTKPEQWEWGSDYLLVDENDEKVRCEHNGGNRELVLNHCRKLSQSVCNRQWWGPSNPELQATAPNGEAIIISKSGIVYSGQHRGIGLILAWQRWNKAVEDSNVKKLWTTEPVMDSVVNYGVDESPKMTITLDNTLTRTPADVLFTSVFKDLTKDERSLCSRMMAVALDNLRVRTGADDKQRNGEHCYRTNAEMMDFFDRHKPHLLEALKTIITANKDNPLQDMGLSPGRCTSILYLMGCSETEFEDYQGMELPNEKALNWSRWEKATEFFTELCKGNDGKMKNLKHALDMLADEGGARHQEKNSLLSKAWRLVVEDKDIDPSELVLEYRVKDAEGKLLPETKPLEEFGETETPDGLAPDCLSDFGGIDVGEKKPTTVTATDVTAAADEERQKRQDEAKKEIQRKLDLARKGNKATNGEGMKQVKLPDGSTVSRPMTRKEVEAENTRRAAEADAELEAAQEEQEQEEGDPDELYETEE